MREGEISEEMGQIMFGDRGDFYVLILDGFLHVFVEEVQGVLLCLYGWCCSWHIHLPVHAFCHTQEKIL